MAIACWSASISCCWRFCDLQILLLNDFLLPIVRHWYSMCFELASHCDSFFAFSSRELLDRQVSLYMTPSCSPGSLFTRFCSQSSKSFAASLCIQFISVCRAPSANLYHSHNTPPSYRLFVPLSQCPTPLLYSPSALSCRASHIVSQLRE